MSHPLLTAPIGPALLRLAGPTTGVMALQILVAIADIWLMGRLGTDALAAIALVFPVMALMVNSANGGIGGGVASALAVWRGRLGFAPALLGIRLQRRLFGEILQVGVVSVLGTLIGGANAILVTGLVGGFGAAALAGYGVGVRLEFMLAPLAFGIGTGLTTLVGVAAGAADWKRAVRVAWIGGLIAFVAIGAIGWTVALLPESWSRLFTGDRQVIDASVSYITHVAPFYCLFGSGLALYFASQGAGRMTAPFLASIARLVVTTTGGWFAVETLGLGLDSVFAAIAAGIAVYGCLIGGVLLVAPWGLKRRS